MVTIKETNVLRLPATYELQLQDSDDRFQKVKVWVAHTGENLNHTSFDRETLEGMSKTLPYTPIVGYIEPNKEEDDDFSDHRQKITVTVDGVKIEYSCVAYGFVPEDANAKIEYKDGKEWLTCIGYIWTKFSKAMNIFESSNGTKSQSMEIDNVSGHVDSSGLFHIEDARFTALCILGDHVPPAMSGANVSFFERSFSHSFKLEFQQFVSEVMGQQNSEKGVQNSLEKANETEVFETVETEETEVETNATEDYSEKVEETVEEAVAEESEEVADEQPEEVSETEEYSADEEEQPAEEVEAETEPESSEQECDCGLFELKYQLSHEDIRSKLYDALEDSAWIIETTDTHVTYQTGYSEDSKFFKSAYAIEGDKVVFGETVELFSMFLTEQEKSAIESQREMIESLNSAIAELQEFKAQVELGEKLSLIDSYATQMSTEVVKEFKDNASNYSLEELDKELIYAIHKNDSKNMNASASVAAYSFNGKTESYGYGSLDAYFNRK